MNFRVVFCLSASLCLLPANRLASMTVSLVPSFQDALVGDTVIWEAHAWDAAPGTLWYRFRVRPPGGSFQTVVDYGPRPTLRWMPLEQDGSYEVEVSVRHIERAEEVRGSAAYNVKSRVGAGRTPIISPTLHPLVFVYSAPPCAAGSRMRVEFDSGPGARVSTPAKPCVPGRDMNFLLAGMRSGTEHSVRQFVQTPAGESGGPVLAFTPDPFDIEFNTYRLRTPAPVAPLRPVLLQSTTLGGKVVATDLEGNLLWYYPEALSFLTRPVPGGTFMGIFQDPALDASYQAVREFDLAGNTLRETNAARVSEQLRALGKREITAFHHEADVLPGGSIVVLASTEQILTDVQGSGPVNVLGEMIVVLDPNLQVEWAWDALDYLDPGRAALQNETCTVGGGGCPPFYLTSRANDWLHANAVTFTPDGNLLMSIRHQDWIIKIDYANGRGGGDVLWRLGQDGDFTMASGDPDPWFSHQHDARILPGPDRLLTVFDNGNARFIRDSSAKSRGQMYQLDEENLVATLVYNVELGAYAPALGSAQRLPNGNFHFDVGFIQATTSRSVETDAEGRTVFDLEADGPAYRTFRMESLYTP